MTWLNGVVAYVLIWVGTLFCVLPFGVRTAHEHGKGGEVEPGQARSAPLNPRIGRRILATTAIAAALWLVYWYVRETDAFGLGAWLETDPLAGMKR